TGADLPDQLLVGRIPRWAHFRLERRKAAVDQARAPQTLPPAFADCVPPFSETVAITVDVFLKSLKREVRGSERQVHEKGIVTVIPGVPLERLDGMLRNRDSGVIAVTLLDFRKPLIVQ